MEKINELAKEIHRINKEKGFWDNERNVGEMLMLVVSELSEALEADRENRYANNVTTVRVYDDFKVENPENFAVQFKLAIKDSFEDEIADTIIRLLDISIGLGIDIESHIKMKMAYNKTRDKMHGKKY